MSERRRRIGETLVEVFPRPRLYLAANVVLFALRLGLFPGSFSSYAYGPPAVERPPTAAVIHFLEEGPR